MQVVPLDRELEEPEPHARGSGQGAADAPEHLIATQRWEPGGGTQGHVNRHTRDMRRASPMRHSPASARGRTTGPRTTPSPRPEVELALPQPAHLETGRVHSKIVGVSTALS